MVVLPLVNIIHLMQQKYLSVLFSSDYNLVHTSEIASNLMFPKHYIYYKQTMCIIMCFIQYENTMQVIYLLQ